MRCYQRTDNKNDVMSIKETPVGASKVLNGLDRVIAYTERKLWSK